MFAQAVETPDWVRQAVLSLAVVIVAVIIWFVVRWMMTRWFTAARDKTADADLAERTRMQRLETLAGTVQTLLLMVLIVGVVIYVMVIWGIPVGPLVAFGSVIGIAVGFGAQGYVKDVIGGFLVVVENQYAIGDVVTISGVSGTVEEIRLRTTLLRDLDGSTHHVANGNVSVTTNRTPDISRLVLDLPISYSADIDAAIAAIADEAARFKADPDWEFAHVADPEVLGVDQLGDSGVVIRTLLTTDPAQRWAVKREFLRRVKYRLDAEGIEMA